VDFYEDLQPHALCLAGDPTLLWLFVFGNMLVASAYTVAFTFVTTTLFVGSEKGTLHVIWLMWGFVVLCGLTHVMGVVVMFRAGFFLFYGTAAEVLLTGVVSWAFVVTGMRLARLGYRMRIERVPAQATG
jgi:hypothetical protein